MTKAKNTATQAEGKTAQALIADHVARNSKGATSDERGDMVSRALENWLDGKGTEVECARRAVSELFRKRNRQSKIRKDNALDISTATHGGRENYEEARARRYSKAEEDDLRDAVLAYCRAAYQLSWDKPWDTSKGTRLRKSFQVLDAEGVKVEAEARERLDALSEALDRARAWAGRVPKLPAKQSALIAKMNTMPVGAGSPARGGPAARALSSAADAMSELASQLVNTDVNGWLGGSTRPEELRRFLWRARFHPGVLVALGCTRRPPHEKPDSKPNGWWVTTPDAGELTVIWILFGGWPDIREWKGGITVKELINRKTKPAIVTAMKMLDETAK